VTSYRTILDSPHVFAAVLLVLLIGILFDTVLRVLERRLARGRPADRLSVPA
jgi:NitT/TauT family transport system permease protein